jgi:hypothetical protein
MLVFVEGGKPENPEKNPRSKGENQQQTQLTYVLVSIAVILQDLDKIFSKILLKILSRTCRIFQVLVQDLPRSYRILLELPRT